MAVQESERRFRTLVVDDEPGILNFVRLKLKLAGFDVLTATSGERALSLAESEKPDIMLLDILMAPMSGLEVLEKLREFSQMPVIVFTGNTRVVDTALKLGASAYISKPFDPDVLIKKIQEVVSDTSDA